MGPREDNAGNLITQGCLMAEELNVHFSSVFTRGGNCTIIMERSKDYSFIQKRFKK